MKLLSGSTASLIAVAFVIAATAPTNASTVAYLDSGTNLAGVAGFNFVDPSQPPIDESEGEHGTTISQVLSQYRPLENIVSMKVWNTNFELTPTASEAALAFSTSNPAIRVIDLSSANPVAFTSLQAAVNAGKILVFNAGNSGQTSPEGLGQFAPALNGRAMIVGAVDASNTMLPSSSRAGNQAEHYLVAPGFNQFSSIQGTSFAKPHVSGAAATLLATFPTMTPEEVVQLLFDTATDLGQPGVDPVYGHGRVNLQAALEPQPPVTVPPDGGEGGEGGEGGGGGGGGGGGAGIALVAVLGGALAYGVLGKREELESTLVLDRYGRGYTVDLAEQASVRSSSNSMSSMLDSLRALDRTYTLSRSANSVALLRASQSVARYPWNSNFSDWTGLEENERTSGSLHFQYANQNGLEYRFGFNSGVSNAFGGLGLSSSPGDEIEFMSANAFTTPYLGFANAGYATQVGMALSPKYRIRLGIAEVDESYSYGLESDATVFELSRVAGNFSSSVYFGQLNEKRSLFGGASGGTFGVDATETYSVGLSGSYRIGSRARLIANYVEGYSSVDDSSRSLLSDFSGLRSNAWGAGLLLDGVFRPRDRIGFAVSQQLRVSGGQADLTVPKSIDSNGAIQRSRSRVDLSPSGRETAFEGFYQFWRGQRSQFTAFLMHQREPNHNADAPNNTSILGVYEYHF